MRIADLIPSPAIAMSARTSMGRLMASLVVEAKRRVTPVSSWSKPVQRTPMTTESAPRRSITALYKIICKMPRCTKRWPWG